MSPHLVMVFIGNYICQLGIQPVRAKFSEKLFRLETVNGYTKYFGLFFHFQTDFYSGLSEKAEKKVWQFLLPFLKFKINDLD